VIPRAASSRRIEIRENFGVCTRPIARITARPAKLCKMTL